MGESRKGREALWIVGGIAGLWVSVWDSDGTAHGRRWIRVPGVAVEHMGLAEWTLPQKGLVIMKMVPWVSLDHI